MLLLFTIFIVVVILILIAVTSARLTGEVHAEKKHGRGKMHFANGDTYDGDWLEGKINGKGVYFHQDTSESVNQSIPQRRQLL